MRHPLNRPTPRTMEEAWGQGAYFDPFERYTRPLHKRPFIWLGLAVALGLIAILWSRYA